MLRSILLLTTCAGMALSAIAAPMRHPITTDRVAAAVSVAGFRVSPDQVTLLSDVVATTDAPQLRVRSIEPSGERHAIARLECAEADQCLPFFVRLRFSPQPEAATSSASDRSSASAEPAKIQAAPIVAHRGSSMTLLLDSGHVHITLQVTSLENGTAGQQIRVADKDHHLVYTAQVVSETVARGRF